MGRRTFLGAQHVIRRFGPAGELGPTGSGDGRPAPARTEGAAPPARTEHQTGNPRLALKGEAIPVLNYDVHDPHFPFGRSAVVAVPDPTAPPSTSPLVRDMVLPATVVPVIDSLVAALGDRDQTIRRLEARLSGLACRDDAVAPLPLTGPATAVPVKQPFIVAVGSRKGGIGKTTTAVNLAFETAERGWRTLLVDVDAQGHAAVGLGLTGGNPAATVHGLFRSTSTDLSHAIRATAWPGLWAVPADPGFDGHFVEADVRVLGRALRAQEIARRFDLVILDLPPTHDCALRGGLACADALLIPLVPHPLALDGVDQLLRQVRGLPAVRPGLFPRVALLPVMVDHRIGLHRRILDRAIELYSAERVLRGIRTDIRLAEAFEAGQPIRVHNPRSRGALDYHLLAEEVLGRWLRGHPFRSPSL